MCLIWIIMNTLQLHQLDHSQDGLLVSPDTIHHCLDDAMILNVHFSHVHWDEPVRYINRWLGKSPTLWLLIKDPTLGPAGGCVTFPDTPTLCTLGTTHYPWLSATGAFHMSHACSHWPNGATRTTGNYQYLSRLHFFKIKRKTHVRTSLFMTRKLMLLKSNRC